MLHKGSITLKFNYVLKNYIKKGFFYDLIGALPIDLILGGVIIPKTYTLLWAMFRLTRLIAIFRLTELVEKF